VTENEALLDRRPQVPDLPPDAFELHRIHDAVASRNVC